MYRFLKGYFRFPRRAGLLVLSILGTLVPAAAYAQAGRGPTAQVVGHRQVTQRLLQQLAGEWGLGGEVFRFDVAGNQVVARISGAELRILPVLARDGRSLYGSWGRPQSTIGVSLYRLSQDGRRLACRYWEGPQPGFRERWWVAYHVEEPAPGEPAQEAKAIGDRDSNEPARPEVSPRRDAESNLQDNAASPKREPEQGSQVERDPQGVVSGPIQPKRPKASIRVGVEDRFAST